MKNKPVIIVSFILSLFLLSSSLINFFGVDITTIVSILLIGIVFGVFIAIYNGYFMPTKWLFRNRFWISGFLAGIGIFLFSTFIKLSDTVGSLLDQYYFKFILSLVIGMILLGVTQRWWYLRIKAKTHFAKHVGERVLMDDVASMYIHERVKRGRIILTSMRLVFVKSKDNKVFVFHFSDLALGFENISNFGIPNGMFIPEKVTRIRLQFSNYWIREITKIMNQDT